MRISTDTALRPKRISGMDVRAWLDLQSDDGILIARAAIGGEHERITPPEREVA